MKKRLNFMAEKKYIERNIVDEYEEIVKLSDLAWKLHLKNAVRKNDSVLDRVIKILERIEDTEKRLFESIIIFLE